MTAEATFFFLADISPDELTLSCFNVDFCSLGFYTLTPMKWSLMAAAQSQPSVEEAFHAVPSACMYFTYIHVLYSRMIDKLFQLSSSICCPSDVPILPG